MVYGVSYQRDGCAVSSLNSPVCCRTGPQLAYEVKDAESKETVAPLAAMKAANPGVPKLVMRRAPGIFFFSMEEYSCADRPGKDAH
jgi:hypothetical protein